MSAEHYDILNSLKSFGIPHLCLFLKTIMKRFFKVLYIFLVVVLIAGWKSNDENYYISTATKLFQMNLPRAGFIQLDKLVNVLDKKKQIEDRDFIKSILYIKKQEYDKAIEIVSYLLDSKDINKEYYILNFIMAFCYFQKEDFNNVKEYIDKCISQNPSFELGKLFRGILYYKSEQYDLAEKEISKINVSKVKNDSVSQLLGSLDLQKSYYLALIYEKKNDFKKAKNEYLKISNNLNMNIIENFMILSIKETILKGKGTSDLFSRLGDLYKNKKEYEQSTIQYLKAIELEPNVAVYHFNLGNVYYIEKDYKKAIFEFDKTVDINSNLYKAYYELGEIYLYLNDINKAKECYLAAIKDSTLNENAKSACELIDLLLKFRAYWRQA